MNLSDEILEELTRAQKSSIMLTYRIKTLLSNAELWEKKDITYAVELILQSIYALNNTFVSIGKKINFAEHFERNFNDFPQEIESEFDKKISVSFENENIYHAVFAAPPLLKTRVANASFIDAFTISLQQKTGNALPEAFEKYDSAYVIYINHWEKAGTKAPYYDNDNVAIKSILDAVVPYICIDDSIHYCENLYLTVNDNQPISELYIVKKGCLRQWMEQHKDIHFASEITSKIH